jgi:hypothetical protein
VPEELYRYLLMSRVVFRGEQATDGDPLEYWRGWLQKRTEGKHIGYA